MPRGRHKEWKNGRYQPKWTCRIIWFEEGEGENIRLELEDYERKANVYPASKEAADQIWFLFKQGAPPEGVQQPFVADLLALIKDRIPQTKGV